MPLTAPRSRCCCAVDARSPPFDSSHSTQTLPVCIPMRWPQTMYVCSLKFRARYLAFNIKLWGHTLEAIQQTQRYESRHVKQLAATQSCEWTGGFQGHPL